MTINETLRIANIISDAQERIDDSWLNVRTIKGVNGELNSMKRALFEKCHKSSYQRIKINDLMKFPNSWRPHYNIYPPTDIGARELIFFDWLKMIQPKDKISKEILVSITIDEAIERSALLCDDFTFESFEYHDDSPDGYHNSAMVSLNYDCSAGVVFSANKNEESHEEQLSIAKTQKNWLFHVSDGLSNDPDEMHLEKEIRSYFDDNWGPVKFCKSISNLRGDYAFELIFSPWDE